jgi:hypothetical protein
MAVRKGDRSEESTSSITAGKKTEKGKTIKMTPMRSSKLQLVERAWFFPLNV